MFNFKLKNNKKSLLKLENYIKKIPSINSSIEKGFYEDKNWWIKFSIDINHDLAWNVVQELGHVLNYLSIEEKLPTVFMPVSPPPYMNGGPDEFLSWIIESKSSDFSPEKCVEWLEGRLPRPVDDLSKWNIDE